ncbi:MAG: biotin-dependent carboxyltransferase family protein [Lentimonas sp.]
MRPLLEIISKGGGLSIQDGGRPGWRRFGVPVGGAMDRHSMIVANRLLGNREDAPVLEICLQGARVRILEDTWLALAGANLGCELKSGRASRVSAGAVLHFGGLQAGLFAYLAVPGGIQSQKWFCSASADPRNGLGVLLDKGMHLSSQQEAVSFSEEGVVGRLAMPEDRRVFEGPVELPLYKGPQYAAFSIAARSTLVGATWTVSGRSDRTGFRLQGPKLEVPASIDSEPVLPGSFQIPGNGQPIVTMVDGPTVGGYAKLAILPEAARDRLAQCAPGTQISFRWLD